jgi:hypothetical protein
LQLLAAECAGVHRHVEWVVIVVAARALGPQLLDELLG